MICIVIEKERKNLYICELLVEPMGGAWVVLNFWGNLRLAVLKRVVLTKKKRVLKIKFPRHNPKMPKKSNSTKIWSKKI